MRTNKLPQPTILFQPQINFYYPNNYAVESPSRNFNNESSILSQRRQDPVPQFDYKSEIEKRFKQSRTNRVYVFPRKNVLSLSSSLESLRNVTQYDLRTQPKTKKKGYHLRIKTEGNQAEMEDAMNFYKQKMKLLTNKVPTKSEERQKIKSVSKHLDLKIVKKSLSPMQPTKPIGSMTERRPLYIKSEHQPKRTDDIIKEYEILKQKQNELMNRIRNKSNNKGIIQRNINLASNSPFHQRMQTMQDEQIRTSSRLKTEPVEEIGYQIWQKRQQNYFFNKKGYNK